MKGLWIMISKHEYFLVLDELRQSYNVSIGDLCDGIISERTYYRYLKDGVNINFNVFHQLLARLKISLDQFINYVTFVRSKENVTLKFLVRVHCQSFSDIEPIYQQVIKQVLDDVLFAMVVKANIKKYEYLTRKITKAEYIQTLETWITDFKHNHPLTIYHLAIYALYFEVQEGISSVLIQQVAKQILELDFNFSFLVYISTLDTLINTIIPLTEVDFEIKRALINQFQQIVGFISIKPFMMKHYLYQAYMSYVEQNQEAMKKQLLHYATNLVVLYRHEQLQQGKQMVQSLFNLDFDVFLLNASKEAFKSPLFKVTN